MRTLTAREHRLVASVLAITLAMVMADLALPRAASLKRADHPIGAWACASLPWLALASGLLVLLPRTSNPSRFAVIRAAGRFALLARWVILGLLLAALAAVCAHLPG